MADKDGAPSTWDANFSDSMRVLRERAGRTQTDLAKALTARGFPFHQPTVQRIETGLRPVRLGEAYAIAEELGVSLSAMTSGGSTASAAAMRLAVESLRRKAAHFESDLPEISEDFARHRDYLFTQVEDLLESAAPSLPELAWGATWLLWATAATQHSWSLSTELERIAHDQPTGWRTQYHEEHMIVEELKRAVERAEDLITPVLAAAAPSNLASLDAAILWRLWAGATEDALVAPYELSAVARNPETAAELIEFFSAQDATPAEGD